MVSLPCFLYSRVTLPIWDFSLVPILITLSVDVFLIHKEILNRLTLTANSAPHIISESSSKLFPTIFKIVLRFIFNKKIIAESYP